MNYFYGHGFNSKLLVTTRWYFSEMPLDCSNVSVIPRQISTCKVTLHLDLYFNITEVNIYIYLYMYIYIYTKLSNTRNKHDMPGRSTTFMASPPKIKTSGSPRSVLHSIWWIPTPDSSRFPSSPPFASTWLPGAERISLSLKKPSRDGGRPGAPEVRENKGRYWRRDVGLIFWRHGEFISRFNSCDLSGLSAIFCMNNGLACRPSRKTARRSTLKVRSVLRNKAPNCPKHHLFVHAKWTWSRYVSWNLNRDLEAKSWKESASGHTDHFEYYTWLG